MIAFDRVHTRGHSRLDRNRRGARFKSWGLCIGGPALVWPVAAIPDFSRASGTVGRRCSDVAELSPSMHANQDSAAKERSCLRQ